MEKFYLVFDLDALDPYDATAGLVAATRKEENARNELYDYLLNSALTEDDWEGILERSGCNDMEELKSEILGSYRHDKLLHMKVEEIWTED